MEVRQRQTTSRDPARRRGHLGLRLPGDAGAPGISSVNQLWLVAKQTDAKGQAITYQYDKLDRMTSKSGTNLSVSYGYDSGTYGVGRRTSMSDGAGTATYTFDQRGRLITLVRTINGSSYQLSTSYDAMDRVLSLTYPNGDVLSYAYGDHGMPVGALLNGVPLVNGAAYNALRKVTSLPLGNGLVTTWQYYGLDQSIALSPYAFYGLPYQVQTGSLQTQTFPNTGNLGYDNVGNPTAITYADHTSESLTFSYNEFDQLTAMGGSASEGYGTYQQTLTVPPYGSYDVGNLLTKGSTTLTYPAGGQARPHAPTGAGATGYSYDANGNRAGDGTYAYTYDVENHLTVLAAGPAVLQNTFDGDGARLARVVSGKTTHYVGGWYEVNLTSGTPTVYYPFNGQAVAMKQGSTLYYLHRDQVGSLVSVSNASGGEVSSLRYGPFGNLRTGVCTNLANLPTDRLFTGQVRDLGDDRFYFFKSRYYDATIGRFSQPDNATADPNRPQSLNRYAYADNCPLKHRDSSGHATELPTEMVTPGIMITAPPPPPNPTAITVAPPNPVGGIFVTTGQLVGSLISVTIEPDLNAGQKLINVPSDQGTLIFKALADELSRLPTNKPDTLQVARIRDLIAERYPGHLVDVGHERAGVRLDIEVRNALLELKEGDGKGLTRQIIRRQKPDVNPEGKPVIGYAPEMGPHLARGINEAGGIAAGGPRDTPYGSSLADLLDVIAPDPAQSPSPPAGQGQQ